MHRYRTTPDGGRRFELPEDGEAVPAGVRVSPVISDISSCCAAWVKALEFTPTPQVATLTRHPTVSSRSGEEQGVSVRWGRIPPFTRT